MSFCELGIPSSDIQFRKLHAANSSDAPDVAVSRSKKWTFERLAIPQP